MRATQPSCVIEEVVESDSWEMVQQEATDTPATENVLHQPSNAASTEAAPVYATPLEAAPQTRAAADSLESSSEQQSASQGADTSLPAATEEELHDAEEGYPENDDDSFHSASEDGDNATYSKTACSNRPESSENPHGTENAAVAPTTTDVQHKGPAQEGPAQEEAPSGAPADTAEHSDAHFGTQEGSLVDTAQHNVTDASQEGRLEGPSGPPSGVPHEATLDELQQETTQGSIADEVKPLTEEDLRLCREAAEAFKAQGNAAFTSGDYEQAKELYSAALEAAAPSAPERAVYHCNRAAAHLKLNQYTQTAQDCTAALAFDPNYIKAYVRRCAAYEALGDEERALADAQKVVELDPGNTSATAIVRRLTPIVEQKREQLKEEMLGKLKDLGNTVLGKFGLSLDNFKAVKDPNTGSYSISFQNQ